MYMRGFGPIILLHGGGEAFVEAVQNPADRKGMDAQIHAAFTGVLPQLEPRRKAVRQAGSLSVILMPLASAAFDGLARRGGIAVTLRDWSGQGAGLLSRVPLDVCTVYRVSTDSHLQLLPGTNLRVVACTRDAQGWYRIGAVWHEAQPAGLRIAA